MRVRLNHDRLRELIARSNLSQNHWAMKLGLSRGHWSDIVNGKHVYPSGKTRERILELFDVASDHLFEVETATGDQGVRQALSDRYLIDREVGHGGMGTVYLARDVRLGRSVAIKVVSSEAVSGIGVQQFLKEVRYTTRLEHPHILPLYDAGEADGHPYYVMPYMREGSLRDRLTKEERLSVDDVLALTRGIGAALGHAHGQRILHCDIKPANVLLAGNHPYVADFGIARAIHSEALEWGRAATLDSSAGTPAYVSPEQATGEPELDARSDVYSLACMVYEMLSGRPPFEGTTTLATVAQRFAGRPPDIRSAVPRLPVRIATTISRAMSVDAERRQENVDAFVASFERGTAHQGSRLRETVGLVSDRMRAAVRRVLSQSPTQPKTTVKHPLYQVEKMLRSVGQDLRFAFRTFKRSPLFVISVVLTLGFGIAANTVVFSLMNPYFFRPLPFSDGDRLVQLGHVDSIVGWDGVRFSIPQYRDYRERSQAFDDLGAYVYGSGNVTGTHGAERIQITRMTGNMFQLLGVNARVGRTFVQEEGEAGAPPVIVLNEGFWNRRFGGDSSIIGQTMSIDGNLRTVIGVMSNEFVFPFGGMDAWVPIVADPAGESRDRMNTLIVGRLNAGWSDDQAQSELASIHRQLGEMYPREDGEYHGVSVKPLREALNFVWPIFRAMFALLFVAVSFTLIIVCVNVANLIMARSTARSGEVAVRAALGAGRWRLVRQFLTESLMLGAVGAAIALVITNGAARFIDQRVPEDWYRIGEATIDGRVLLFASAVTLLAVSVFGLIPALASSRTNLSEAIKEGSRGAALRSLRARRALVVFQIAMAVVLVVGLGLASRSMLAAQRVDLGFAPEPIATFTVSLPASEYPDIAGVNAYFDRAVSSLEALPEIRGAATASTVPQNHEVALIPFAAATQVPPDADDWPVGLLNRVSEGYFDAMDIQFVGGRDFNASDGEEDPRVTIVSERLARAQWPAGEALGQTILYGDADARIDLTVIGVVGDVHHEGVAVPEHPQIYVAMRQGPSRRRYLIAAAPGGGASVINAVRRELTAIDRNLPVSATTMSAIVGQNLLPWKLSLAILAVLGGASLLLASIGIYGVTAYSVEQRRREIGVRMALGASAQVVRQTFVKEGLRLAGFGAAIGLLGAAIGNQILASMLFGVGGIDVLTLGGVVLLFIVIASLASFFPAMSASRVHPMRALRCE